MSRSDEDFIGFCKALCDTNQEHIVRLYLSKNFDNTSSHLNPDTTSTQDASPRQPTSHPQLPEHIAAAIRPLAEDDGWKEALINRRSVVIDVIDVSDDLLNRLLSYGVMNQTTAERCKVSCRSGVHDLCIYLPACFVYSYYLSSPFIHVSIAIWRTAPVIRGASHVRTADDLRIKNSCSERAFELLTVRADFSWGPMRRLELLVRIPSRKSPSTWGHWPQHDNIHCRSSASIWQRILKFQERPQTSIMSFGELWFYCRLTGLIRGLP